MAKWAAASATAQGQT